MRVEHQHGPEQAGVAERALRIGVTRRGKVTRGMARRAAEQVAALERYTRGPLLSGRVVLTMEANPAIARPAHAEGELVLGGDPIRAHASAETMRAAVDELSDRLRDQLRRHDDRRHRTWRPPA